MMQSGRAMMKYVRKALLRKDKRVPTAPSGGSSNASCLCFSTKAGLTRSGELSTVECHPSLKKLLSHTCRNTYEANCLSEEDIKQRAIFFENLQTHLRKECHPKIELELFGSSSNGFGFPDSDIDLCMSFKGHTTDVNVSPSVLNGVKSALLTFKKCRRVVLIKHAQVPIVTFHVLDQKFTHGDISLYNRLAVQNSKLLCTYANLDKRCMVLGYAFKDLIKRSPPTSSASSYALIVMVIHFLQQCTPSVLPVLQELYTSTEPPLEMVGGWNSWFYDDIGNIESSWLGYGLNTDSVGELWFKLLQYYSEFDFEKQVVTIRQYKKLDREKKIHNLNKIAKEYNPARTRKLRWHHWVKRLVAVEDPFDQVHNLMGGVPLASVMAILETIQRSYQKVLKTNNSLNK